MSEWRKVFKTAAFGASALRSNTTGARNATFGQQALLDNTSGDRNSAFEDNARQGNTTGVDNAALGSYALALNQTGHHPGGRQPPEQKGLPAQGSVVEQIVEVVVRELFLDDGIL